MSEELDLPRSMQRDARTLSRASALLSGALTLGGAASAQSLVSGGVVTGAISVPGEQDTYTFVAADRQRFELRLVDVAASDFHPRVELFNPGGVLIASSASPDVAVLATRQVVASTPIGPGTYTVVVSNGSGAGSQTGAYDLYFVLAPGPQAAPELLDGVTVLGEIERGELETYTFTSLPGQTVEGIVTDLHGDTLQLRVERFAPNFTYSFGTGAGVHFTTTSSFGGVHALVVSDGSGVATGTGRYSIVLHGVATQPPYPPSVFLASEQPSDPLLLDTGGHSGLGPRIGDPAEPFNVALDCSSADAASFYSLLVSTQGHAAASTPWGFDYLDAPFLLRTSGSHAQSTEAWFPQPGLALPNDPALIGATYTVQGFAGGFGGSIRLSSAITQTIGS